MIETVKNEKFPSDEIQSTATAIILLWMISPLTLRCFLYINVIASITAVLPTAQLTLSEGEGSGFVSVASFSSRIYESDDSQWTPVVQPLNSSLACDVTTDASIASPFILVVKRGECSFEEKAKTAESIGASTIVIVNTLEAIYAGREFGDDRTDYECSNGEGWLPKVVNPVWDVENNDERCSENVNCASGQCIVTNITDPNLGTKVCCAWDLYLTMGGSSNSTVGIQSVFMNMKVGASLLSNPLLIANDGSLQGDVYLRPDSYVNPSSILIWLLGVFIAIVAAKHSAKDVISIQKSSDGVGYSAYPRSRPDDSDSALDLTLAHTIGFIAFASVMLMVLFFFNLSSIVTILYCVSAGSATATIIFLPLLRQVHPLSLDRVISLGSLGSITMIEVISFMMAYAMTLWWFMIRDVASYEWVLQDLFGCCLCIVFLSALKLSSLHVAAALLTLAFVYDIFWVFISPLLFNESVMVAVATGGYATEDPDTCEKYPDTVGCVVSSLPMLLKLPRINSYLGGSVILGLGDIVLPGLLLSFACRYDAFKGLSLRKGYFIYISVGYAVGLMMANLAVIITGLGQPALLYLVPCTLGVMCFVAWADGNLRELWDGPIGMKSGSNRGPLRSVKRESEEDSGSSLLYNL